MATFKDPTRCFAPLEVIDRMLAIKRELGCSETIYLQNTEDLTDFFDSFGFDIYAYSEKTGEINFGDYRTPLVPGGYVVNNSTSVH